MGKGGDVITDLCFAEAFRILTKDDAVTPQARLLCADQDMGRLRQFFDCAGHGKRNNVGTVLVPDVVLENQTWTEAVLLVIPPIEPHEIDFADCYSSLK